MAAKVYNIKVTSVTDKQRQLGKAVMLGCQYGMGFKKFIDAARIQYSLLLEPEFAKKTVETYRSFHAPVPTIWRRITRQAAIFCS